VTRVRLERTVDVAAPASVVWDYVTDWPRQAEWVPMTRVEVPEPGGAAAIGGTLRAWTGLGPVGFWDPMTITSWERQPDGGGRCEVLHRGRVVRGEGEFTVVARGEDACRFVWAEVLALPLGALGRAGWPVARPLVERMVDRALAGMRENVEQHRPRMD
jgi:hypothetical protein